MNVQKKAPSGGRGRIMKKNERLSPEEQVKQLLNDHKKSLGEMICIKIDERTSIEHVDIRPGKAYKELSEEHKLQAS